MMQVQIKTKTELNSHVRHNLLLSGMVLDHNTATDLKRDKL